DSTLSRNGSRPPNLAAQSAPSSRSGSPAITVSRVTGATERGDVAGVGGAGVGRGGAGGGRWRADGAEGWAPIHSSASGPGAGAGRPCSSALAGRVPHG